MSVFGFTFARGGSKGLPRKHLLEIDGVPLIGLAIRSMQQVSEIERIVVSTDDPEIAEVAKAYGAEVPFLRPAELATDDSPEWASFRHAVNFLEERGEIIDLFVNVPATAPLRLPEDVRGAIDLFKNSDCDFVLCITEAERSPYFTIVTEQPDGFLLPPLGTMNGKIQRRQDAPKVFDVTPVAYVTTPAHVKKAFGHYDGRVKGHWVPRERAVDIDTPIDLELARVLYARRKTS